MYIFLFVVVFIAVCIYAFYPLITLYIQKYIQDTKISIVDFSSNLEESSIHNKELEESDNVIYEFIKRIVIYYLQPILHRLS
jgi:hypothetical protein